MNTAKPYLNSIFGNKHSKFAAAIKMSVQLQITQSEAMELIGPTID